MAICPTCGQRVKPVALDAVTLYRVLMHGTPHREVYRSQDGGWWVTHGGGETTAEAVQELIDTGQIQSVYNSCPGDAYHVGKTLDMDTTLAERKNGRLSKNIRIYTDGSREIVPRKRA